MKNFYRKALAPILLSLLAATMAYAQTNIKGKITDGATGEELAGVNIIVKGRVIGTITDTQGQYDLSVTAAPPFTLVFSFVGYATQEIEIKDATTTLDIKMNEQTILGQEVVVSASRTEESILKSPVTIEKLDLLSIKQSASPDFYDALANVKGVQVNNGSLNFTAVNTRGFATIANTRFVQWVDGMDTQAPLLNFPTGTIMGLGELDAESIELIPGAASALYGPNAFNGIMIMKSKSPFEYQGLSAQVKTGITNSDAGGAHPLNQASIRYAKAFNNKLAFKVNFSYMKATDWYSNDYKTDRQNPDSKSDRSTSENFDGLNLYGDETPIPTGVPSLGDNGVIRRTGFKEGDLLDNRNAITIKGDAALHYRITDKIEILYNYRYGGGNSIYQGQAKYALRDFNQQFHKLELKGDNFFIRGYLSATDAGKSYNMDALGGFVNEAFNPTQRADGSGWAQEYVLASQGYIPGVAAGNPSAARAFADRNMYTNGTFNTAAFRDTVNLVRKRFFQRKPPGASFYDNSKLWHAEFYYNFNKIKWAEIIVGGNFRQYSLFSNGTIFNEDPEKGTDFKRIFINTYGVYTQIAKTIAEKLKLTGSIRYDKMDNFDGHFTPRISGVYTFNENHNIRANFQTGFRLPDTQAQYIYFPSASGNILGGVSSNAERYGLYNGGAYSNDSYKAFVASGGTLNADGTTSGGTPSLLSPLNLSYIKPEQLWSYEVGYKGVLANKLLVDLNYYYTSYSNFIGNQLVVNKVATQHQGSTVKAGTLWAAYVNSPYTLTSYGLGAGLTYSLPNNFSLTGNYNYATFSGTQSPDFQANFNTPKNKYNIGLSNRKVTKNLGFNVNFRYQDAFFWQSSYGEGNIPAYGVVDAQVSYKVAPARTIFKIGGTNLGGGDYRTNIGSPFIGQMYYVSITYDQFLK
ncbi:MAG TPA: TonB-dependent receptor [Cyclobacteriaceae bacterium]|jgi:outer membrane receptor protein involved in Fe transport|nr:TonB-dependent receptor [Cyclobacteriaceae bacterium]